MKRILVIDGMGGGIGRSLVAVLKQDFPEAEIVACGTNALATQAMLKAGADIAVTGENAIMFQVPRADAICGTFGIVVPHAMQGELSPRVAEMVAGTDIPKFLLPLHKCYIHLAAPETDSLSASLDILLEQMKTWEKEEGQK